MEQQPYRRQDHDEPLKRGESAARLQGADLREQLLTGLLAVHTEGMANFAERGYADWSIRDDDGTYHFEIGETGPSGDVIRLYLSHNDLAALHGALTATLLANDEAVSTDETSAPSASAPVTDRAAGTARATDDADGW